VGSEMNIPKQTRRDFYFWLGEEGTQFFSKLWIDHGEIPLVLEVPGKFPHPIHFREGVQVRNWMRDNTDLPEEQVENNWREFVLECLGLSPCASAESG